MPNYSEDYANVTQELAFIEEGLKYISGARATGVADAGVFNDVVVKNPSGSGVMTFCLISHYTGGLADLDISNDITIDTAGTALTPINAYQDGTTPSPNTTVEERGSYTVNGDTIEGIIPGGSGPVGAGKSGSPLLGSTQYLLEPGESVRELATNRSGSSTRGGVVVTWFELPR